MNIAYFAPLSKAYKRMKNALFKPFNINKWFAVGFTAFLAGLLDWYDDGTSSANWKEDSGSFNIKEIIKIPEYIRGWINENPDWFALIIFAIVLFILFFLLLTWLSSRGKFMFLDNVIHDRSLIKKPWAEFKTIGNSLFLWRTGYGIITLVIFVSYVFYCLFELYDMYYQYASESDMIYTAIQMAIILLILVIIAEYISLFLNDFVVPLMYKNNCRVWIGWSYFIPLFTKNFFHFLLYGLFIFFLGILVAIVVVTFGFLTCCIGFVILIIPYIGSVILLPVSYTFRGLSIDFLEQFGENYKIFPDLPAENQPE